MKISLAELKRAVQWIEANTSTNTVGVMQVDLKLYLKCFDRQDSEVEIQLFDVDTALMPKIKKSERL